MRAASCFLSLFVFSFSFIVILSNPSFVCSHEGHHAVQETVESNISSLSEINNPLPVSSESIHVETSFINFGVYKKTIQKIGGLHLLFLHFPIALIVMTVISELFYSWKKNLFFDNSSRFMLFWALLLTIPTVLFGFALAYHSVYVGNKLDIFIWHRNLGLLITTLLFVAVYLKEYGAKQSIYYYIVLTLLLVGVCFSGYLGGELSFG